MKTLDLEKVFIFCKKHANTNIVVEDALLRNSANVEFLQLYGEVGYCSKEDFEKSRYYEGLLWSFNRIKRVYNIVEKENIWKQGEYYIRLYQAIKNGTYNRDRQKAEFAGYHSSFPVPVLYKMANLPGYYMIQEGHHRLACHYVLGNKNVEDFRLLDSNVRG